MHLVLAFSAALGLSAPALAPASTQEKSSAQLAREARAAYDKGDKATFLANYEEIARRRPGDVYVLYNLACGQALNGQTAAAEKTLLQIAALRAASNLDADTDFDSIRQTDGYKQAAARMAALRKERISSGAVVFPSRGTLGFRAQDWGHTWDRGSVETFVSRPHDLGGAMTATWIDVAATVPAGTTLRVSVRSADDAAGLAAASWGPPHTTWPARLEATHAGRRFVQWRAELDMPRSADSPIVDRVRIHYR